MSISIDFPSLTVKRLFQVLKILSCVEQFICKINRIIKLIVKASKETKKETTCLGTIQKFTGGSQSHSQKNFLNYSK